MAKSQKGKKPQKAQNLQKRIIYRRRRLGVILLLAAGVFFVMAFHLFQDTRQLRKLEAEKAKVQVEEKNLNGEISDLKADVKLLSDDEYVAKLARSRFYFSKDGELIFALPESQDSTKGNN